MGLNFYHYDGLQPEIRAGIINEHECIPNPLIFDRHLLLGNGDKMLQCNEGTNCNLTSFCKSYKKYCC